MQNLEIIEREQSEMVPKYTSSKVFEEKKLSLISHFYAKISTFISFSLKKDYQAGSDKRPARKKNLKK